MSAREMAQMYKRVGEILSGKQGEISQYYSNLSSGLEKTSSNLTGGPGEAEGKILTDFLEKEGVWRGKYQTALMGMQNGMTILSQRITEAATLASYWEAQAKLEEMKKNVGL